MSSSVSVPWPARRRKCFLFLRLEHISINWIINTTKQFFSLHLVHSDVRARSLSLHSNYWYRLLKLSCPFSLPQKVPENHLQKSLLSWKCCHICAWTRTLLRLHWAVPTCVAKILISISCISSQGYRLIVTPEAIFTIMFGFFSVFQDPFQWLTSLFHCHFSFSNGQTKKTPKWLFRGPFVFLTVTTGGRGRRVCPAGCSPQKSHQMATFLHTGAVKKKKKVTDFVFF